MLEYRVSARRIDAHGSLASCKDAQITLDTDVAGRPDAFNPAELLLAALAACMIKGIERVTPTLAFRLRGVAVQVHGERQDSPPMLASVDYELTIDTDESDHRLELLHTNVRKFGTVFNTLAAATRLHGRIRRGHVTAETMPDDAGRRRGAPVNRRKVPRPVRAGGRSEPGVRHQDVPFHPPCDPARRHDIGEAAGRLHRQRHAGIDQVAHDDR